MRKSIIVSAVAWCALLSSGSSPLAQDDITGPLEFSLKLEVEFTDNRDAAPDGLEEDNTDLMIKPRIGAMFDGDRTVLNFYYEPTYRYRTDPSPTQNDDDFLHDLAIRLRHAVTPRCILKVSEFFNLTDDPSVAAAGTTLRRDSSFTINRVEAGLTYDINRQSKIEVDGNHKIKSYDEDVLDYLDEERASGSLRLFQKASRTMIVVGEVKAESFEYEDMVLGEQFLVGAASLDRGFTSLAAGVGVDSEFRNNCRASGRVGYIQLEYENDGIDSEGAPYVSGRLEVASVPSTRFTAAVTHTLRDADVFPFASQSYTDLHAGVEVDTTARVTVGLSATYRMGDYSADQLPSGRRQITAVNAVLEPFGGAIEDPDGDETTITVKGSVVLELSEDTVLKGSQQYEDEDSDVSTSFTRNATSIFLVRSF